MYLCMYVCMYVCIHVYMLLFVNFLFVKQQLQIHKQTHNTYTSLFIILDSNLGTPVINMISPASNDPSTVTVSWDAISDPDGLLESYKVYVVSDDETDYSAFSSIEISGTQAVVRGINPSKGYYITVVAISTATSESNRLLLPAVSQSSDISSCEFLQNFINCTLL